MDDYDKLREALAIIQAIRESDCWEFIPVDLRERVEDLMPEGDEK